MDRIKYNDDWLKRFLEHNENDLQESLSMLWESCTWRRKVGANGKYHIFNLKFISFFELLDNNPNNVIKIFM